jgi:predicted transcriptional regulator
VDTRTANAYAAIADARERDPIVIPGEHGRADVASGRMNAWLRFNHPQNLVTIHDAEGHERYVTRSQRDVYRAISRLAGSRQRVTIRHLATLLSLSPSTVSRTSVKLAAFGLIAYQANRGRYGGTVYVLRRAYDQLDWFREEAKAKVRQWAKATERRFARLQSNVASYLPTKRPSTYLPLTPMAATLKRAWTAEDLRSVGL